jgi:hypothetical protein
MKHVSLAVALVFALTSIAAFAQTGASGSANSTPPASPTKKAAKKHHRKKSTSTTDAGAK